MKNFPSRSVLELTNLILEGFENRPNKAAVVDLEAVFDLPGLSGAN